MTPRRLAALTALAAAAGAAVAGCLSGVRGRFVTEMTVGELLEVRYCEACS